MTEGLWLRRLGLHPRAPRARHPGAGVRRENSVSIPTVIVIIIYRWRNCGLAFFNSCILISRIWQISCAHSRIEFMPNDKSARALSGENACPRCGCPVFEAEKLIAANKASKHDTAYYRARRYFSDSRRFAYKLHE